VNLPAMRAAEWSPRRVRRCVSQGTCAGDHVDLAVGPQPAAVSRWCAPTGSTVHWLSPPVPCQLFAANAV